MQRLTNGSRKRVRPDCDTGDRCGSSDAVTKACLHDGVLADADTNDGRHVASAGADQEAVADDDPDDCEEEYEDADDADSLMLDEDSDAPNLVPEERARGILAGRIEMLDKIGEGGMGAVWRGYHLKLDRPVAVKVLDETLQLRPDGRERFIREGKALALLDHPNVVRIYDCDQLADGKLFLCMELLDGETLRELIKAGERLDALEVIRIGLQVCDAIESAHARGILHRDLTPSNIIRLRDPSRTIKVIDWGLCKYLDLFYFRSTHKYGSPPGSRMVTPLGCRFGTPEYMAPEMILRENPGPPSFGTDVYALGIVLYELLTGRHPFKPGDRRQPRPIQELIPGFDYDDLESALRNALRFHPEERTPTMATLREDLELARDCVVAQREAAVSAAALSLHVPVVGGVTSTAAGASAVLAAPGIEVLADDAREQPRAASMAAAVLVVPKEFEAATSFPAVTSPATTAIPSSMARGWIAAHKVALALVAGIGIGGSGVLGVQEVGAWHEERVRAPLAAALEHEAARARGAEARAEICEGTLDAVTESAAPRLAPPVTIAAVMPTMNREPEPIPRPEPTPTPVVAAAPSPELRAARERRRASARALDGALEGVRRCYDRHGGSRQTELKVRVRLDAAGKADDILVLGDSATTLQSCVATAVRAYKYPAGDGSVVINHTFALMRKP